MDPEKRLTAGADAAATMRRYDIDWLRLMAVFLLFFFHTARFTRHTGDARPRLSLRPAER